MPNGVVFRDRFYCITAITLSQYQIPLCTDSNPYVIHSYPLLFQRFCMLDRKYIEPFQRMFVDQYTNCHRLETNKLRNVAKFFAHLLHTDAISWEVG